MLQMTQYGYLRISGKSKALSTGIRGSPGPASTVAPFGVRTYHVTSWTTWMRFPSSCLAALVVSRSRSTVTRSGTNCASPATTNPYSSPGSKSRLSFGGRASVSSKPVGTEGGGTTASGLGGGGAGAGGTGAGLTVCGGGDRGLSSIHLRTSAI